MSRDCCDCPGTGAGFLSFFVIGLLVYGLTTSDELWPRLQRAVGESDPSSITSGHEPRQKAATVEWDELLTGHGLHLNQPDGPNRGRDSKGHKRHE